MRIFPFLLILACRICAAAAEPGIIFRDDFTNNRNGWKEVFGLKDLKAVVENGKFVVNNNLMQTWLSRDGVLAGRKYFDIEATFSNYKSDFGGEYGLKFGTADQRNSYTFLVNGQREFQFSATLDGNKMPPGPWQRSEHIRPEGNKLTLRCFNGTLDMIVNGRLVEGTDCAPAPWDRAGFIVGAKVAVDADDFVVREPGTFEARPDADQPRAFRAPKKAPRLSAMKREAIFQEHKAALRNTADRKECDAAIAVARRGLAQDKRLADADLKAELDYAESAKTAVPPIEPGAACAAAGYKQVLLGAVEDRLGKDKKNKKAADKADGPAEKDGDAAAGAKPAKRTKAAKKAAGKNAVPPAQKAPAAGN